VAAGRSWRLLTGPVLLLAGLVLAGMVLRAMPDRAVLAFPGAGRRGPLFVIAAALACAVGAPRQAVAFAGGYAFGPWGGSLLTLLASGLACAANFFWARAVARDWVRRRLGARLAGFDRLLEAHPFRAVLTLRLLPVGNNLLLNLLAGVSPIPAGPFLAASLLGYVPQTVIFALLGAGIRVGRPVQLALAVVLFAASAVSGLALLRKWKARGSAP
jgi:uncharacterized membrane protein YdjX (TVP38/TMEM64 family)